MSTKAEEERINLLQGPLDLLILRTLLPRPAHGHAIAKGIERNSEDVLLVEQGALYPALHRLIKRGWISVAEGTSENNRRAKFYRLTPKGQAASFWNHQLGVTGRPIGRVLRPAQEESQSGIVRSTTSTTNFRHHIERETRDNLDRGMTHEEACAALVVILTFALGIGLDTAVSNIVNAVLDPSCFRIGRI